MEPVELAHIGNEAGAFHLKAVPDGLIAQFGMMVPRDNQGGNGATIRVRIAAVAVTKGGRSPTGVTATAAARL
jgi:hypothetical protein